jgi:polyhydroxybutyrate depolymerase
LTRSYLAHVPPAYDKNNPISLVLNFHGGGGSAEGFRRLVGMDETSDREGFIVVYPKGMRVDANPDKIFVRFWNPGKGPSGAYNKDPLLSQVDDVGFVNAMLDDLESKFNIDKNRIYACGLSNGAVFVQLLACRLSSRIAAAGAVAGPFWNDPAECVLERPVPIIYFHGSDDPCLLYNGGLCGCEAGIAGGGRKYISAEETVGIWRAKDGCSQELRVTYQNGDVTCKTYKECAQGAEVTFCTIAGGGHTWPGGKPYKIPGVEVGKVSYDISANDAIWEFFKKHPKQ